MIDRSIGHSFIYLLFKALNDADARAGANASKVRASASIIHKRACRALFQNDFDLIKDYN